jgi:beta-N-acetylhexosaminidase
MKNRKAFITGLKTTILLPNEKKFLKKYKPWGVILFSRNIKKLSQAKKLVLNIKKCFKDKNYPILIDQEGGRINRLNKIIDFSSFSAGFFGELYNNNITKFNSYYKIYINQTSYLLNEIGININTVPVLDVKRSYSHSIIGDRSFSSDPKKVSDIGNFCIEEFKKNKIGTVIKHIPGHGLSKLDSHKVTPVIIQKTKILYNKDFKAFKNKKSFFAMTAHIVYNSIDNQNTATHSKKIIKLIRNKIGFKNILISDDISMKGLKFSIIDNTIKAFNAGCNIVLHCNGKMSEMIKVAANSPKLDNFLLKKTSQFYRFLS